MRNKILSNIASILICWFLCCTKTHAQTQLFVKTSGHFWLSAYSEQFSPRIPGYLVTNVSLGVEIKKNEFLMGINASNFYTGYHLLYGWDMGYRRLLSKNNKVHWKLGLNFRSIRFTSGASGFLEYNYEVNQLQDASNKMSTTDSRLLLGVCEANIGLNSWWSIGLAGSMGLNNYSFTDYRATEKTTAHVTKFVMAAFELNMRFKIVALKVKEGE